MARAGEFELDLSEGSPGPLKASARACEEIGLDLLLDARDGFEDELLPLDELEGRFDWRARFEGEDAALAPREEGPAPLPSLGETRGDLSRLEAELVEKDEVMDPESAGNSWSQLDISLSLSLSTLSTLSLCQWGTSNSTTTKNPAILGFLRLVR